MAISAIRWQAVTKMTLANHLTQEMNALATVTAWGEQAQRQFCVLTAGMITVLGGKRILPPPAVSSSPFLVGAFQDSAQFSMLEASTQVMLSHLQVAVEAQGCR